jgi:hypothetical protein
MKNFVSIGLGLLAFPAVASAHLGESRNMWENEMKKRCPDHHVDWVGDGEYPALIDAYDATLSAKLRNDLKKSPNILAPVQKKSQDIRASGLFIFMRSKN